MFTSLSKRSNVPGLRSVFVVSDAELLKNFLLYRTYHGSAMSIPVQRASIAAWNDEQHVIDNRRLYQEKFEWVIPILQQVFDVKLPDASFYIRLKVPDGDDLAFARNLWQKAAIQVLPGRFGTGYRTGQSRGRLCPYRFGCRCRNLCQSCGRHSFTVSVGN